MELDRLQWVAGLIVATVASIWGQAGLMLQALLLMMALDIFSGWVAAWGRQELDSNVGWIGLRKKLLMLSVVAAAVIIQPTLAYSTGTNIPLAEFSAGFLCAVEALSVVENAGRAGVPIPRVLRDALARLRDTADGGDPNVKPT